MEGKLFRSCLLVMLVVLRLLLSIARCNTAFPIAPFEAFSSAAAAAAAAAAFLPAFTFAIARSSAGDLLLALVRWSQMVGGAMNLFFVLLFLRAALPLSGVGAAGGIRNGTPMVPV